MKILLTGANGYIGRRLMASLIQAGHQVVACVRDANRFPQGGIYNHPNLKLLQIDFLSPEKGDEIPVDIEVAYYLIHSMSTSSGNFSLLEEKATLNFLNLLDKTLVQQIIYLGGISNEKNLSKHLSSRKHVADILHASRFHVTTLNAGIIVGSGSASFEIIRDLVEKLPIMVAPRWLQTRCQPIAIRDVLQFLTGVLLRRETYNQRFDIAGPDILSYKEMLLQFAEVRQLKRLIVTLPVMTPKLSSYWLYFVTSTSYRLAVNLVDSMKIEVVASDNRLAEMLGVTPISYKEAVKLAFQRIEQNEVVSSWKDAMVAAPAETTLSDHIEVPSIGCFTDYRRKLITGNPAKVLQRVWSIGGDTGWHYANWLWIMRGWLDKLAGGPGLRRGRTNPATIHSGDVIDFWRVLVADESKRRLLLFAEMKLPGEAWLEFNITQKEGKSYLNQKATFRAKGVWGRLYWYAVLPFHFFVFEGMARNLSKPD